MSIKLKSKSKIVGVDDGPFIRGQSEPVPLVGVITRGSGQVDGIVKTVIEPDGDDVTRKLSDSINSSKHANELSLIVTDGITFGGFNVVDLGKLETLTGIPVLAVTRKKVDYSAIRSALGHLPDGAKKWKQIKEAGDLRTIVHCGNRINYQSPDLSDEDVRRILKISTKSSSIPEPVRLAHMIASAYVRGES